MSLMNKKSQGKKLTPIPKLVFRKVGQPIFKTNLLVVTTKVINTNIKNDIAPT